MKREELREELAEVVGGNNPGLEDFVIAMTRTKNMISYKELKELDSDEILERIPKIRIITSEPKKIKRVAHALYNCAKNSPY